VVRLNNASLRPSAIWLCRRIRPSVFLGFSSLEAEAIGTKRERFMNTYQLLNMHMKGSRGLYAASWIAIAVSAFFGLLQPQIIRVVLDVGIGGEEWTGNPLVGQFIDSVGGSKGVRNLILPAAGLSVLLMALSGIFLYLKGPVVGGGGRRYGQTDAG
jgi:hypothetical protein